MGVSLSDLRAGRSRATSQFERTDGRFALRERLKQPMAMPELAEVEFYRKRWHRAAVGEVVTAVRLHPTARVFRGIPTETLRASLAGATLVDSTAAAKQMVFRFRPAGPIRGRSAKTNRPPVWLGIHLGMSGELSVQPPDHSPRKHDHLVLCTASRALVFSDPRMFGRVLLHHGTEPPGWWAEIAPPILSPAFTAQAVAEFLGRRARAPIKAVLLMQESFPGIGNWMADEILWRAAIHPARPAGSLKPNEVKILWRECRRVCRLALDTIAGRGDDPPRDLNVNIPSSWLFHHRWEPGGVCPRTGVPLERAEIGGRTTCWSPARQPGERNRLRSQKQTGRRAAKPRGRQ